MKNILLLPVLLLCAFGAKAQNPAPALPAAAGKTAPLIFEKTYLHTDRDVYAQGDTLWFKAYLVNGQDDKPIASSGTLYVELLAPDSAKIVNREIIRLDNGLGNGDIELTDSLPSGKYRLRAYTNWMRNFGDNFVFEKNITILNIQAIPPAPEPATKATKNKEKDKKKPATATPAPINNQPIVRFYPEGGSLVEGISSIVGIKAEDGYGSGIPVTGAVLSSAGDTVTRFSCDSLGMGLLAMLPVKGQTYHAVVNLAGGRPNQVHNVFNLPPALSKGLTLQIRQTDSVIHAIISRSNDTTAGALKPGYVIVVKHAGKTLLNQQLQLQSAQASANIATGLLPEGISAITLYDELGKPACERLVYIHHPGSSNIIIKADKKKYQPKEKVNMQISAPANSSVSMAVVDADIVPEQSEDITAYLMLRSEVKGNIENAGRYFDTTNVNRFKQLNLLLLTQGWRDFVWRRLADTAIRISYAAENGINVPGRVRDEVQNKMLAGLNISLYAGGAKGNKLFSAVTDSSGHFNFGGLMLYGKQNIKLGSINDQGKRKGSFMIDTVLPLPVKPRVSKPEGLPNLVDSTATAAVKERVQTMKTSKIMGVTRLKEVTIKNKKSVMTRGGEMLTSWGPEQIFNITPDDYQYKTLEWFMLQKVKGAVASSRGYHGNVPTGVEFLGIDTPRNTVLMPPELIVNGEELYMNEQVQAEAYRNIYFPMPMNKFKKVVLKRMTGMLHGMDSLGRSVDAVYPNVMVDRYLLYLTLTDDAMTDNPGSLNKDIPGYYQARQFYTPPPNAKSSLADYRTTIYWEPNIKTDATGKANVSFYNAVPQTNARVIVQGITADGKPLAAVTAYDIKEH